MNIRDWKLRLRALLAPRQSENELRDEIAGHLEHETQKLMRDGLSAEEARRTALARFGSVTLVADQCRDTRGTAFVDSAARDIHYAWRTFRRAPLTAATIVATVGIGLGMAAVAFTFYSTIFLRTDAVHNPNELFVVRRPPQPNAKVWMAFTRPQYEALRRETNVFIEASGVLLESVSARIDGHTTSAAFVTGNFFRMAGVDAALGRTLIPDDDAKYAGRSVVVLSHKGKTRIFGGGSTAVGERLLINGAPFEVVGVMPDNFAGLRVTPDFWAPLSTLGTIRAASLGKDDDVEIDVIGRLKPGISAATAAAALTTWVAGNPDLKASGNHPKTAMLIPAASLSADKFKGLMQFAPIFFAFGLILMIGCANVANLLLARGMSRQREIGVRLSLGASRARIVRQLLTESLILALAAAIAGMVLLRLVLEVGVRIAAGTLGAGSLEDIRFEAPPADWRVMLFLLGGAIVSTAVFGLAPALQATRLELVRTMRGEVTKDSGPSRWRSALVAVQVGASALLLISATVFLRSAMSAAAASPGIRTADTLMVDIANEHVRTAMVEAVKNDASVASMAASYPGPLGSTGGTDVETTQADGTSAGRMTIDYRFVSPEYFGVFDINVVKGRGFSALERQPEANVIVLSESAARKLWPDREAVGQIVRLKSRIRPGSWPHQGPEFSTGTFVVVGIVRDVRDEQPDFLFRFSGAGVYLPTNAGASGTTLTMRVNGDPDQARRGLIARLTKIDPGIGNVTAMHTIAGMTAYLLSAAFWIAAVLGGLALALTLSGLFGVLSYIVEQRRQEIGVRMALGATARHIVGAVLSESVRPVAVGLIVGTGLAGTVAAALMSSAAAAQIGRTVRILDPAAYAASLILVVTACLFAALIPAMRAARIDPMVALKRD